MKTLISLAIALALAGCASVEIGKPFEPGLFCAKAQRGVSTDADIKGWLGEPQGVGLSVEPNGDNYYEWTYYHAGGRLPSMADTHLMVLQVKFDAAGVMRAYSLTASLNAGSCRKG
jgi:hypothetical protein